MDVFFRRERRGVSIVSRRRYRRKVYLYGEFENPKWRQEEKVLRSLRRRHFLYVAGVKVKNTPRVGWNKITRGDRDRTKRVCVLCTYF